MKFRSLKKILPEQFSSVFLYQINIYFKTVIRELLLSLDMPAVKKRYRNNEK
jgi:hypothetical protein